MDDLQLCVAGFIRELDECVRIIFEINDNLSQNNMVEDVLGRDLPRIFAITTTLVRLDERVKIQIAKDASGIMRMNQLKSASDFFFEICDNKIKTLNKPSIRNNYCRLRCQVIGLIEDILERG